MEWTTETNQKQPRECWNVKKNQLKMDNDRKKYNWNSDKNEILVKTVIRRKNISEKNWKK